MQLTQEQCSEIERRIRPSVNSDLHAFHLVTIFDCWLQEQKGMMFSEAIQKNQDAPDFHAHGVDVTEGEQKKMSAARLQVFEIMKDGQWRTIDQIQAAGVNAPPQSITIYLRSFRETQYGGYTVDSRKVKTGARVFEYSVTCNPF